MRSRVFLALVPLLLALAAPASAERAGETLDRILPQIRLSHPGRLSDAQPWTDDNGDRHYRIKWMTFEGRILYFDANARTGRFYVSGGDDGERWRGGMRGEGSERPYEDRGGHRDNWSGGTGSWSGGDWRGGYGARDNGGWHHYGHSGH